MADEPLLEQPAAVPVAVEQAPAPAAVVEVSPPAAAAAPVAAEPVAEPAAAPVAPERTPSLLEAAIEPAKDGDKPAEPAAPVEPAKPAEPEKPAEAPKPVEPDKPADAVAAEPAAPAKPEPLDYKYEMPAGMEIDEAGRASLHELLDGYRADPSNVQPLIEFAARRDAQLVERLLAEQHRQFADTKQGWRTKVMADEQIGGAGHQTAMGRIARMRDTFVSNAPRTSDRYKAELAEFTKALDDTGAGDHPAILRFIDNVAAAFDEPAAPSPDIRPAPQPRPRGGAAPIYDNTRSNGRG